MTPNLCSSERCSGCMSCLNACPTGALTARLDAEGFWAPGVDETRCVGCGRCERACPALNPLEMERTASPTAYACWNNDPTVRAASSSGGMFSVYADLVLERGGVVFGAALDEKLRVRFAKAETREELARMRSSKYVQAEVGLIYRDVERELDAGRDVLFVGTPCQVAGLYGYLRGDRPNLWTCDLICHGTPPSGLFRKWLDRLEKQFGPIASINMRDKSRSWSHFTVAVATKARPDAPILLDYDDRDAEYAGRMFLRFMCLRASCSQCAFSTIPRIGDVTLGDFWGLGEKEPFPYSIELGASLNLANGSKGEQMIEDARTRATFVSRPLPEAVAGNWNLSRPTPPHPRRDAFLRDALTLDYAGLTKKYRVDLYGKLRSRIRRRIRALVSGAARTLLGARFVERVHATFSLSYRRKLNERADDK